MGGFSGSNYKYAASRVAIQVVFRDPLFMIFSAPAFGGAYGFTPEEVESRL